MAKLTDKQALFCREYLRDLNGTQAAIRAGYSSHTANEQSAQLLAKLSVQAEVARLMAERCERIDASADQVIRELSRIAFHDGRSMYRPDGTLKPPEEWDDATAATVAGIESFEEYDGRGEERELVGHTKKLKRWDKVKALELLGKHLGMFVERQEHSGPGGGPMQVEHSGEMRVKKALDEYASVFDEIDAEAGAGAPVRGDRPAQPVDSGGPDSAAGPLPGELRT